MDTTKNPYTPWEGTPPPLLAGRKKILLKARVAVKRAQRSKCATGQFILGRRGTGKSVILKRIYQMAYKKGCETIFFQADTGQTLSGLLATHIQLLLMKLDRIKSGSRDIRQAFGYLNRITGKGFSGGSAGSRTSDELLTDLKGLLQAIGISATQRKTCVVILIDEIQNLQKTELGTLILALDRVIQEKLPFLLFGAGLALPETLRGEVKLATERLMEITEVEKLGRKNATKALVKPAADEGVEFETGAVDMVLKETSGYPGLLQAWGAVLWDEAASSPITSKDVENAGNIIREKYDNEIYKMMAERLTRRQLKYALAMAALDQLPAHSTEVAGKLGMNVSRVAPVRDEVIGKGVAFSPGRGLVDFSMPFFGEYLKRTAHFA